MSSAVGAFYFAPEPPSFSWPAMWDPSETKVERLRNLASLVSSWCDWGEGERRDSERVAAPPSHPSSPHRVSPDSTSLEEKCW